MFFSKDQIGTCFVEDYNFISLISFSYFQIVDGLNFVLFWSFVEI